MIEIMAVGFVVVDKLNGEPDVPAEQKSHRIASCFASLACPLAGGTMKAFKLSQ